VVLFSFLELLSHPSLEKIFISGLALGTAQMVTPQAWVLWPYFLVIIILFYTLSVVRDWNITSHKERWSRFSVRAFRYCRSLLIIFFVGTVVFYLSHLLYNSFNWQTANKIFFDFYGLKEATTAINFKLENIEYSWPTIVLIIMAGFFLLINLPRQLKETNLVQLLNHNFPTIALAIFAVFHLWIFKNIGVVSPLIFLLIAKPLKNFITIKNKKEIIIVIAHEIFRFSAKWLILMTLLFWYLINSLFLYF
jgi:hypothetical protein